MLAEEVCEFFCMQHGIDITVLRIFNVYGPGQNENFLVPEIIGQAVDRTVETIYVNDLSPKRDYTYIDDLVLAIISTIEKTVGYSLFNIGSGKSYSVEEVIRYINKILRQEKPYKSRLKSRKNEIFDVYADISKAKIELNFSPETALEEGLAATIKHIKESKRESESDKIEITNCI
jgi:nucleoside-diphosphate-sugar epimerase